MKKVFSHENRLVANNIKNILQANDIAVMLKNEFASSAIGEISPFDSWIEVWIKNSADYQRAKEIVAKADNPQGEEWRCQQCNELNGAAFQVCWNCQFEPD